MGFDVLACVKFKIFMCIRRRVNRRTDRWILKISSPGYPDSKLDFNGFPDPAIAGDCGFAHFLGPDFGLLKVFCPDFGFRAKF